MCVCACGVVSLCVSSYASVIGLSVSVCVLMPCVCVYRLH